MRRSTQALVASLALIAPVAAANADVLFQKNGYADLSSGQITGPSGYFQAIGSDAVDINLGPLVPGNYGVDFFHNSGAYGSDFSFSVDGSGNISAIGTGGNGANSAVIATGVGTQTLALNSHSITYNANAVPNVRGQTGSYYIQGQISAQGQNSAPVTTTVIPGGLTVDNLYNPGQFTEDYSFFVNSDGSTASIPGFEQYATFSGANVSQASILTHFDVVSDQPMVSIFGTYWKPTFNLAVVQSGPTYEYTFDMILTPGNEGQLLVDFQNSFPQTFVAGDALKGDNSPWTGTVIVGDVPFAPKLYQSGGMYYFVTTGGLSDSSFSTITGTNDNTNAMTTTITATLVPEPASLGLLAIGGLAMLRRRSRRA